MGKTAFAGPVYGAKSLLFGASFSVGSTGATTVVHRAHGRPALRRLVPHRVGASFSTASSGGNAFILKSEGGSSGQPRYQGQPSTVAQTLATINSGTSTSLNAVTTITPTAGEYEGLYVPGGSTLRIVSSGGQCAVVPESERPGFHPLPQLDAIGGLSRGVA
jgi:hypothetical protein